MTCSNMAQVAADDLNQTLVYANKNNTNATLKPKIFNVTYDISNSMASAVGECYLTGYGYYEWGINTFAQFNGSLYFFEAFL